MQECVHRRLDLLQTVNTEHREAQCFELQSALPLKDAHLLAWGFQFHKRTLAAEQQNQIRIQLADVLECAVGQTLLPKIGGGRTAVFEIMIVTPAIRSMILQSKTFQIVSAIQTGKRYGMQLLDDALEDLVDRHVISLETALAAANEPDKFKTGRQT